jgi:hypothetical protein
MCNLKRLPINLVIFLLLCSMFVGCSKTDNILNQSSSSKAYSSVATTSSPANEKTLNNSEGNKTITVSPTLESWIGDYTFSEFAPPDQNMFYTISLYKENSDYYAKISIDGFQTIERLQAKVSGDENSIILLFYKYLPDNQFEPYTEGDTLLSFEKRNSDLYTSWGKIQPMLESNIKSGEEYFKVGS